MMTSLNRRGYFRSLLAGSLLTVSLILTSCSMGSMGSTGSTTIASGNNGKNCTHVGVLLPDTTSSTRWEAVDRPDLIKDIQAAVPGAQVSYHNALGNSATQFSQAQTDMENGDCILVVAPHDSIAATNIVELANAHNVPVIAYDRLIQSKSLDYYVSFDNVKVGALQADYISKHFNDEQFGASETPAKVAIISGSQTDTNALLFSNGMHSILDPMFADNELEDVYETFTPDWNNSTAQTEMETFLSNPSNSGIRVAYVANDGMAGAVIAALKTAGLSGKVLVTGQDATGAGVNNILAGTQSMTVYKPIAKEAQSAADVVKAIHDGTSTQSLIAGKFTTTYDDGSIPSILDAPISVDISNINQTVIKDGFLTRSDICQNIPPGTADVC